MKRRAYSLALAVIMVVSSFIGISGVNGVNGKNGFKVYADSSPQSISGLVCSASDGAYYKADKVITFTSPDANMHATIDAPEDLVGAGASQDGVLTTGFKATREGEYVLTFVSGSKYQTTTFVLDKTTPVIEIGGKEFRNGTVINGGTFKQGVSPKFWDDVTVATAVLSKNGMESQVFNQGYLLDEVAIYTLTATDTAGNSKAVSFYIEDSIPPAITTTFINNGFQTTGEFTVYATVNDGEFTSTGELPVGLPIQTVSMNDISSATFNAKYNGIMNLTTTIPTGSFPNYFVDATVDPRVDNKWYNSEVTIFVPNGATAALDGTAIVDGAKCNTDGLHTIVVTNDTVTDTGTVTVTSTVIFGIDKTAPTLSGATAGAYYNLDKNIYFNDGVATYTLDADVTDSVPAVAKGNFSYGDIASEEGYYTVTARDLAGNTRDLSFFIDKTPPRIDDTPGAGGLVFDNGSYTYLTAKIIDTSEPGLNYMTVNGTLRIYFSSGTSGGVPISTPTTYTCPLITLAETTYYFTVVDKAGNVSSFSIVIDDKGPDIYGVVNNALYNTSVAMYYYNSTATLKYSSLSYSSATAANAIAITSGYQVLADGYYVITATDADKNATIIQFQIDKVPPVVNYNGTAFKGGNFNLPSISLDITGETSIALKRNNSVVSWYKSTPITSEGNYELTVTDGINPVKVAFSIDRTVPVVVGADEGGFYTYPIDIQFTDELTPPVSAKLNGVAFAGGSVSKSGSYMLVVTDGAGNSITRNFTMSTTGPVISGVKNGGYYKKSVTPTVMDGDASVDGEYFVNGMSVSKEGPHRIEAYGYNGMVTVVYFTIDKTAPVISVKTSSGKTVKAGATVSGTVKVKISDAFLYKKAVTKNGKNVAFGTGSFKFKAKYVITATDKAGNIKTYKFTIR